MDFEKRQAKGFARFEIPESIKERALELVAKAQEAESGSSSLPSPPSLRSFTAHLLS
jgi:hypothetical protein